MIAAAREEFRSVASTQRTIPPVPTMPVPPHPTPQQQEVATQGVRDADRITTWVAQWGDFYDIVASSDRYVIMQKGGGKALAQFPNTPQGWAEAWHQFRGWETSARTAVVPAAAQLVPSGRAMPGPPAAPSFQPAESNWGRRLRRFGRSWWLFGIAVAAILGGIGLLADPDPSMTRAESLGDGIGALAVGLGLIVWWGLARLMSLRSERS
jgi:hypothetical protein